MKRFVALSLLVLGGCSAESAPPPAVAPMAVAPTSPPVPAIAPQPTATFTPVDTNGVPLPPGGKLKTPALPVRAVVHPKQIFQPQAQVVKTSANSAPLQMQRQAAQQIPAVDGRVLETPFGTIPVSNISTQEAGYLGAFVRWREMFMTANERYTSNPSRANALATSATVDAIWAEHMGVFAPPRFSLADSLLRESLKEMRSGFLAAKFNSPSSADKLEAGFELLNRSNEEVAQAVRQMVRN